MKNEVMRRISLLPEVELPLPNALFAHLGDAITSLIDIPTKNSHIVSISDIYTTTRVSGYSEDAFQALLATLPPSLRQLPRDELGPLEADLLSFLLNCPTNKMLTVVGDIGVGKTSLIRFTLYHLRKKHAALQSILPVYIDFLDASTKDPSEVDVLALLMGALKLMPECAWLAQKICIIEGDIVKYHPDNARVMFLQLIEEVVKHFKGSREVFLFIDNNDHVSPQATSMVFDLGRAAFFQHGAGIIVAVRHHTYKTRMEAGHSRGAYLYYKLFVTPPDLRFVIRRRLHLLKSGEIKGIQIPKEPSFKIGLFTITLRDVEGAIDKIIEYLMDSQVRSVLCTGLFNNSIRRSLLAIEVFLRYRDLDLLRLIPSLGQPQIEAGNTRARRDLRIARYDLLNGVMRGEHLYYREDRHKLVPNLYCFESSLAPPDYLIQFHALSLLDLMDSMVLSNDVLEILKIFRHARSQSIEVIKKLIKFGLIVSPETDDDLCHPVNIRISVSGKYYLQNLLSDEDYIYNVVYDIALPHSTWDGVDADRLECRLNSLLELLKILLNNERALLEAVRNLTVVNDADLAEHAALTTALRSLPKNKLLSRHLLTGIKKLLRDSRRSSSSPAKDSAESYSEKFEALELELNRIEELALCGINKQAFELIDDKITKHGTTRISQTMELAVSWPDRISPRGKDKVLVQLRGSNISLLKDPLFVACRFFGEKSRSRSRIIKLSPDNNAKELSGEFILDPAEPAQAGSPVDPFEIEVLRGEYSLGSMIITNP